MSAVLTIQKMAAGYAGQAVVRDLSVTVTEGEVVALLGPNGAGKTTTLLAVSGILPVLAGSIIFAGGRHEEPIDWLVTAWRTSRRAVHCFEL